MLLLPLGRGRSGRRGLDGFRFFGYSLGYYAVFGEHRPERADLWQRFLQVKDQLPENAGRGGIGTPAQLREHLSRYEEGRHRPGDVRPAERRQ
jgi:hypothetical protein